MNSPLNLKELEQLAKACRKAGIKSYKGNGVEFTLSDEAPPSNYKKSLTKKINKESSSFSLEDDIASDMPGTDAMLFWSADGFETQDDSATD